MSCTFFNRRREAAARAKAEAKAKAAAAAAVETPQEEAAPATPKRGKKK